MATASIIQRAWKGGWVCIVVLWSIRKFQNMFLGLCQSVPSIFPILRDAELIEYFNALLKPISSPRMTPNACFYYWYCLRSSLLILMTRGIYIFEIGSKNPFVPLSNPSGTKLRYFSIPILSTFNKLSIISLGSSSPVVMSLTFYICKLVAPVNPQLLFKNLHIWHIQFPDTRGCILYDKS